MSTKLIELEDGTLVEVEATTGEARLIDGRAARRVDSALDGVKPVILKTARSLAAVWQELNKDLFLEQAEIEFGLSFEGEGNIYITKAKTGANLSIKLNLKPKE